MIRHSRYHHIDSAIIYGFAVLSILILANFHKQVIPLQKIQEKKVVSTQEKSNTTGEIKEDAFLHLAIKGKAYVVYDIVDKKIISGKNADTLLPLASLTKIMTVITAKTHNQGRKLITIAPGSIEDGYDLGLQKGQSWKLDELLKYTLVFSSNDGAQAIADGLGGRNLFVQEMNIDAKNLGLALSFTHPAGLDIDGSIGGSGSALSVAKLAAIARKEYPEIFDATTKRRLTVDSSVGKIIGIPNTNQDVINFPGLELSKTGFTDRAGGNLVVIIDVSIGHPVAIVVLGSTRDERFSDMETLYTALQKSLIK